MKILVINGHPDKESYCQANFQTIVENIDLGRHELEVINLNEEDFDPVYVMAIENVWTKILLSFVPKN